MRKYGFKIFSSNLQTAPDLIKECGEFILSHDDTFIELMVTQNSTKEDLLKIKEQLNGAEVRIHAPHHAMGFDAGNRELEAQNRKILAPAQMAADMFDAQTIVVHAGRKYDQKYLIETVRQFRLFNDSRIVVENLPYLATANKPLHGNNAEEIKFIMREAKCGFCFDFSHAVCAALALNIDVEKQLQEFFALKPNVYHLCDGDMQKAEDLHLHFGEGNYDLAHFLNDYTDKNAYITMETGSGIIQHNDMWVKDYKYLKALIK